MSISNKNIVSYLVTTKITDYDYENATGEKVNDANLTIGVDVWDMAFICAAGDFTDAGRKYNVTCGPLWNNFNTALYAMNPSDLDSSTTIKNYFRSAFEADYTENDYPDDYTFKETYNVIFNAIVNCWLYELYSRIEAEKMAEDKKKKCQKLLYDIVGKAAISPTMSDPLDESTSGANNISSGAAAVQGDMSTDLLEDFTDGFDGF